MDTSRHRWLFSIEDSEDETYYLDADGGTRHAEEFFVGTDAGAEVEGKRRADLWESDPANGMVMRVTREGHGVVSSAGICRTCSEEGRCGS